MVTKVPQRIIASTGVTIGSYTNSSITVNQSGQITSASSGSPQETTPKITSIQVTNSSYQILDDTAVDVLGGYIKIIGTGFSAGCQVLINNVAATSTTFVSATEVRAQLPATAAGTYVVYLINTDGGVAIRVNGITFSATPSWVTASILNDGTVDTAISIQLAASSATTYQLQAGSTLPTGLSLSSGGLLSGTVTGIANDTTYSFTVVATDLENQDSPRTFSITIGVSDPYYRLTTLYLPGNSGATIVTDASTNNFPITVVGDSRASNFSPYLTGWSNLTDCSTSGASRVDVSATGIFGTDISYTIEGWYNFTTVSTGDSTNIIHSGSYPARWVIDASVQSTTIALRIVTESNAVLFSGTSVAYTPGSWVHIAIVNDNTANTLTFYINGTAAGSRVKTSLTTYATLNIGYGTGNASTPYFVSNFRIVSGSALYSANFTPSTVPLTAVAGTALLIFQSNRFVDASATPRTLTVYGSNQIRSFNPFGLTNTGTTGSMYFDGTGDYLTWAGTTIGANPFCFETWVYFTGGFASIQALLGIWVNGVTGDLSIRVNSATQICFDRSGVSASNFTVPTLTNNQWYHIVACRDAANNSTIFVNGIRSSTGVVADSYAYPKTTSIAGLYSGVPQHVTGYMSNVRLIVGSTPYDPTQTTLTVPTAPLAATANTQLLTLQNRQPHNNHSFQDSSTYNWLITRNGNPTQGSFSPFSQSGWSTLFNGSNGLSVPSNAALSFSGEFTWETFVYYNAIPGSGGAASFIMRRSNTASGSSFQFGLTNDTGQYKYFVSISVSSTDYNTNWNVSAPSVGRWYHVAVVRDNSSNMHCWLDGIKLTLSGGNSNIPGTTNVPSTDVTIGWRNYYNDLYLNGYLSNLRLSAAALYSGSTFTVPAQAFDPSQANTRLLICHTRRFVDQGSANLTIGFNYYPSVQAFSPFAPPAVNTPAVHGASGYFDGSGDYLTKPNDSAFSFGTGNLTVEVWVYLIQLSSGGMSILSTAGVGSDYAFYLTDTAQLARWNGSVNTVLGGNVPLNSWNHIAFVRNGTTITGYLNGTSVGSLTDGTNFINNQTVCIGATPTYSSSHTAYLSNLRIIKGIAVYTGNFTAPVGLISTSGATSATAYPNTTNINTSFASSATSLLLNFTNGAIADATGKNVLETVGDARTTGVISKWVGSHSMYFDGTGDYLKTTNNYLTGIGTGDFTIEGWWNFSDFATRTSYFQRLWSFGTGLANDVTLHVSNDGSVLYRNNDGVLITSSITLTTNTWNFIALVRYNGTTTLYINGISRGSTSTNNDLSSRATNPLYIGSESDGAGGYFIGNIQDFRVTRYARYTANFTPPTGSFKLR